MANKVLQAVLKLKDEMSAKIAKVQKNTQKFQKVVEQTQKKLKDMSSSLKDTGESLMDVSKGFVGFGGLAVTSFVQAENSVVELKNSLGLTQQEAEELNKIALEVSKEGFDFSDSIDSIKTLQMHVGDLGGKELKQATKDIQLIAKTFDQDANEIARAVGLMNKNLGTSSTDALDIIAKGFQSNLDISGDFLDTLSEYSVQFSELGFSGTDTLQMLRKGVSEGAFSVDYLADMLKEFKNQITNIDDAGADALANLGYDFEYVQGVMTKGGEEARNLSLDLVEALLNVEDANLKNSIALGLFRTKFEDLDEAGLKALLDIKNSTGEVQDVTKDLQEAYEQTFGAKMQKLLNQAREPMAKLGEQLYPVIESIINAGLKLIEWFNSLDQETVKIIANITIFGAGLLLVGGFLSMIGSIISGVITFVNMLGVAFKGLKVAVTFLFNPFTLLTAMFVGIIALIYKFRYQIIDAVMAIGNTLGKFFSAVGQGFTNFFSTLGQLFASGFNAIKNKVIEFAENTKKFFSDLWNFVSNGVSNFVEGFKSKISAGVETVKGIWEGLKSVLTAPIKAGVEVVQNVTKAVTGGGKEPKGKRSAFGTRRVIGNNVPYRLHDGEMVLTRQEADNYRKGNTNNNGNINITIQNMSVRDESDINKVANALVQKLKEAKGVAINGGMA